MKVNSIISRQCVLPVIFLLSSCAVQQDRLESALVPTQASESGFVLDKSVGLHPNNAAHVELKAGTVWSQVGTIEQGTVYQTKDQVVVLNSFNVHEGFIVVQNDRVVGFYLPVEKTFVKCKSKTISLIQKGMINED